MTEDDEIALAENRRLSDFPLYKSERQVAAMVGVGFDKWKAIASTLEKEGFPRRNPLTGKRYWPRIKEFLDRLEGVGQGAGPYVRQTGKENWS